MYSTSTYVWEIRWTRTEKGHIDLAKTPLNHPIKQFGKKLKKRWRNIYSPEFLRELWGKISEGMQLWFVSVWLD